MRFYEKYQNSSSLGCKFGIINNNKALVDLQGLCSVQCKRKCDADIGNLVLDYSCLKMVRLDRNLRLFIALR